MTFRTGGIAAVLGAAILLVLPIGGVARAGVTPAVAAKLVVTVHTASGAAHRFNVEVARTSGEQERGLMFRTNLPADGGMLFAPYPAEGEPREASFWMRNTPTRLDILFIRKDGTIARIKHGAEPYSDTRILSGEPVAAVLEIHGGRSQELGIAEGDKVTW